MHNTGTWKINLIWFIIVKILEHHGISNGNSKDYIKVPQYWILVGNPLMTVGRPPPFPKRASKAKVYIFFMNHPGKHLYRHLKDIYFVDVLWYWFCVQIIILSWSSSFCIVYVYNHFTEGYLHGKFSYQNTQSCDNHRNRRVSPTDELLTTPVHMLRQMTST